MSSYPKTLDDARIVLLEAELIQAYHTISFLHGCLTSDGYKYMYPEQTIQRLKAIEDLVDITSGCYHSKFKGNCPTCVAQMNREIKVNRAKEILR